MNLVFHNPLYLFAIAGTAFVVNAVARDGETTWFEGLLLVGVYISSDYRFSSLAQPDGLHGRMTWQPRVCTSALTKSRGSKVFLENICCL